jgi:hypothetical protein
MPMAQYLAARCLWYPRSSDVIMAHRGQMRLNVCAVLGHPPDVADVRYSVPMRRAVDGAMALSGMRGKVDREPVEFRPAKLGSWRADKEFIITVRM